MNRADFPLVCALVEEELARLEATEYELDFFREVASEEQIRDPSSTAAFERLLSNPSAEADAKIAIRGSIRYSFLRLREYISRSEGGSLHS